MKMLIMKGCKKCQGTLSLTDDGDGPIFACINCGFRMTKEEVKSMEEERNNLSSQGDVAVEAGPRKGWSRTLYSDEYLDEHREEIIADYQILRINTLLRKWHISTKRWMALKGRWSVVGKKRGGARSRAMEEPSKLAKPDISMKIPERMLCLPQFPEFDNTWHKETQVKWLEVYQALFCFIKKE